MLILLFSRISWKIEKITSNDLWNWHLQHWYWRLEKLPTQIVGLKRAFLILKGERRWACFIFPRRWISPLGVVRLLPTVDDKVDEANLHQSRFFFFFFNYLFFRLFFFFFCLKKQKQKLSDLVIPSAFSTALFEKTPSDVPAGGGTEKTEAEKEKKLPGESYITGSVSSQTNQKGRRGWL